VIKSSGSTFSSIKAESPTEREQSLARRTNYSFEKRRKELDKRKKKDAKLAKKQERKEEGYVAPDPIADIVPGPQTRAGYGDENDPMDRVEPEVEYEDEDDGPGDEE
jgi:hypothetical protein